METPCGNNREKWMRIATPSKLIVAVALLLGLSTAWIPYTAAAQQEGPAFAVANQAFWDYYQKRGGVGNLGYPISRQFTLRGYRLQLFQRGALQLMPDGSVSTMNLLDDGLLPYTSFNSSIVPPPQRQLLDWAPSPADPDYARKAVAFVQSHAPDQWEGLPVNFGRTFMSSVKYEDAFPTGGGEPTLLPLLNLERWGLPTSPPTRDPNNGNFVYQRFQRGIMHYDVSSGATQGLLLGDYFKAVITGQNLPPDLENDAQGSPFYRQYDPNSAGGVARPSELPDSDLRGAF
jgi:hypothetical protein